jgi:signal transduction histidine kinase
LLISQVESQQLHREEFNLGELIERMQIRFPGLAIVQSNPVVVLADRTAMESVVANLFQNSLVHGDATRIVVACAGESPNAVTIAITDDGHGLRGDRGKLGTRFARLNSESGSGLGLSIVQTLVQRMGGFVSFPESSQGFQVVLTLPGRLVA